MVAVNELLAALPRGASAGRFVACVANERAPSGASAVLRQNQQVQNKQQACGSGWLEWILASSWGRQPTGSKWKRSVREGKETRFGRIACIEFFKIETC